MTLLADPLNVSCPYIMCTASAGQRCTRVVSWSPIGSPPAARPHKARIKLALVLAAHSDPALDGHPFPGAGDCELCGTCGLGARHRVIEAMAGRLAAGEGADEIAADYLLPVDAVLCVAGWMQRWPGAWQ